LPDSNKFQRAVSHPKSLNKDGLNQKPRDTFASNYPLYRIQSQVAETDFAISRLIAVLLPSGIGSWVSSRGLENRNLLRQRHKRVVRNAG